MFQVRRLGSILSCILVRIHIFSHISRLCEPYSSIQPYFVCGPSSLNAGAYINTSYLSALAPARGSERVESDGFNTSWGLEWWDKKLRVFALRAINHTLRFAFGSPPDSDIRLGVFRHAIVRGSWKTNHRQYSSYIY